MKPTFIFKMGMSAPLSFVDQIQLMVAILIDEVTARELIRVPTRRLLHVGPSEDLKESRERFSSKLETISLCSEIGEFPPPLAHADSAANHFDISFMCFLVAAAFFHSNANFSTSIFIRRKSTAIKNENAMHICNFSLCNNRESRALQFFYYFRGLKSRVINSADNLLMSSNWRRGYQR
jgi:hypothetical protein